MRLAALLALCALGAVTTVEGREMLPSERRVVPLESEMPPCHDPAVLEVISSRFAEKESKFWDTALTIVGYEKIRPLAFRPWGLDFFPRRFCTGIAIVSDGRRHRIDYSVREALGFVGASWGVEFCLVGLDRNWAYNPACRMARP